MLQQALETWPQRCRQQEWGGAAVNGLAADGWLAGASVVGRDGWRLHIVMQLCCARVCWSGVQAGRYKGFWAATVLQMPTFFVVRNWVLLSQC